jgi:hypothetical protein
MCEVPVFEVCDDREIDGRVMPIEMIIARNPNSAPPFTRSQRRDGEIANTATNLSWQNLWRTNPKPVRTSYSHYHLTALLENPQERSLDLHLLHRVHVMSMSKSMMLIPDLLSW